MQKGKITKALKPSQRESVTDFSARFGNGISYEDKLRGKKISARILVAVCIIALIYVGFFLTDLLIGLTELPAFIHTLPEAFTKWILSPIIQG